MFIGNAALYWLPHINHLLLRFHFFTVVIKKPLYLLFYSEYKKSIKALGNMHRAAF